MNKNDVVEIEKMKKEIQLYTQREIQPLLRKYKAIECMGSENSLAFIYKGLGMSFQYIGYEFSKGEKGVNITVVYAIGIKEMVRIKGNGLENIFVNLKKEVKKIVLSKLYDK